MATKVREGVVPPARGGSYPNRGANATGTSTAGSGKLIPTWLQRAAKKRMASK